MKMKTMKIRSRGEHRSHHLGRVPIVAGLLLASLVALPATAPAEPNEPILVPCGDPLAIVDASQAAFETPGDDTIVLAEDCTYAFGGGGIDLRGGEGNRITLEGNGATFDDQGGGFGAPVVALQGTGYVTVRNLTIRGPGGVESIPGLGGGVYVTSRSVENHLENVTIEGHSAIEGGGIYVDVVGDLTVVDSTVSGNTATDEGGGILAKGFGKVTLLNSTVSGNQAGFGGGLYLISAQHGTSEYLLLNSTVFGNTAELFGGGVVDDTPADITIRNSVLAGNSDGSDQPDCNSSFVWDLGYSA